VSLVSVRLNEDHRRRKHVFRAAASLGVGASRLTGNPVRERFLGVGEVALSDRSSDHDALLQQARTKDHAHDLLLRLRKINERGAIRERPAGKGQPE